ncbi:hypothetical protein B0H15DRAFT_282148 [Mycena belliarum]|uniref:C2H2-type domain-containing protein n=1 Tax=Mycena belliarum TaxID=1033014 RepID=A0AAD6U671_9AGAR|nr:hypothetical protein B0H15DRAFT_282148 [Mycena belliae]
MPWSCDQCARDFVSKTALYQHYRMAPDHSFCHECDKYFRTEDALEAHNASAHAPHFTCATCRTIYATQSALEDHYRGKPEAVHPKCSRCPKGFLNMAALREHKKTAHPIVTCTCKKDFYEAELDAHYKVSPFHPSCNACGIGFKDDAAYDEHVVALHSDRCCLGCRRQFESVKELKNHYMVSPDHPTCKMCGEGFFDDAALRDHVAAKLEHPAPPRVVDAPMALLTNYASLGDGATDPRSNQTLLPLPDKEQSEKWKQIKNTATTGMGTLLSTWTAPV